MSTKRVVTLDLGWSLAMKALELDGEAVLRRADLPEDLFARENVKLTTQEYFCLWESLRSEVGELLPIRLAELVSPEMFHPAIFAAFCSPNLRVAIERIAVYKRLIAPMELSFNESESGLFVGFNWLDSALPIPPSLALTELTFLTQIARLATRENLRPLKVESPHRMELDSYHEFFGVRPVTGSKHGLTFSQSDADRRFLTASGSMWDIFEPELKRRLADLKSGATTSQRVKSLLLECLPSGQASIENVAARLALSPRSLQRRVRAEGTSFRELLDLTRKQLALNYVTGTALPYGEIAFLLGLNEVSSLFRAFRRWTGQTPQSYREAQTCSPLASQ